MDQHLTDLTEDLTEGDVSQVTLHEAKRGVSHQILAASSHPTLRALKKCISIALFM